MKLYATITSERATKGQGGNKYISITIRDEGQYPIGAIDFYPDRTARISIIDWYEVDFDQPNELHISTFNELEPKAKKQKGEKCANKSCNNMREINSMYCETCRFK